MIAARCTPRSHLIVAGEHRAGRKIRTEILHAFDRQQFREPAARAIDAALDRTNRAAANLRRLRYSDRNRLRRIVNSHADMLVPRSKESMFASARSKVSCTRSSARSTLPLSEMANARRFGTAARTASRTDGSSVTCAVPFSAGSGLQFFSP